MTAQGRPVATKRGKVGVLPVVGGFVSVLLVLIYVLQRVYWMDVLAVFLAGTVARDAVGRLRRVARSQVDATSEGGSVASNPTKNQ